jgi:L-fucose isomerase-like protein
MMESNESPGLPDIGVVCLARTTFEVAAAEARYAEIRAALTSSNGGRYHFVEEPLIEIEDARRAVERLRRVPVEALVLVSGTFHLGHLALELQRGLPGCPLLLWGLDEPPHAGGKIRLNSVCGVNLDASNLYKAGVRTYHHCIGDAIDPDWVAAVRARRALRRSRLGIVGHHAHGFYNLDVDELGLYRELGCLVQHHELQALFDAPAPADEVARRTGELEERFAVDGITPAQLDKVARLAVKVASFCDAHRLDALALRCWPEFAACYGVSPCAAMSLLQAEGRLLACEGDLDGALSMVAARAVAGEAPFLADLSQIQRDRNAMLLWHCGVAPCNLWDGESRRALDTYFAGGKGVTADFVLRPGAMTLLRIDSCDGGHRLYCREVEALPTPQSLKGTYVSARFEVDVERELEAVIRSGLAHHVAVAYGAHRRALELLARVQGWPLVPLPFGHG